MTQRFAEEARRFTEAEEKDSFILCASLLLCATLCPNYRSPSTVIWGKATTTKSGSWRLRQKRMGSRWGFWWARKRVRIVPWVTMARVSLGYWASRVWMAWVKRVRA